MDELSALDLAGLDGVLAERTLVLVPPGASRPRALDRRLDGLDVDWREATGQQALLDSHRQEPPYETIAAVTDWLVSELKGEPVTLAEPPTQSGPGVVGATPDGLPVVEYSVTLGELGLFGIVTDSGARHRGPTIVLVNEGNTHHIGQARIWVDLARVLGAAGFRTLRFDLSGNGDSGTRPGQTPHVGRAPEAIDDIYVAMQGIQPDDPTGVVLVGFCSGAYQVVEQALLHPPLGICVINPTFSFIAARARRDGRPPGPPAFQALAGTPDPAATRVDGQAAQRCGSRPLAQGARQRLLARGHGQAPSGDP